MIKCVQENVISKKDPKRIIDCVKGNGKAARPSSTSITKSPVISAENALLVNVLFVIMVTFGCVFLVLAIIFTIFSCCCCRGNSCITIVENIMLGLAFPALLDIVCYVVSSWLLNNSTVSSKDVVKKALEIAGAYSGYIGISLAAGWLITCLIGPAMTRNNSTCMKMICMVIGLVAAGGLYCAVVLAVPPEKLPNIKSQSNSTTTKDRLYPTFIVAAAVVVDYIIMFFMCTCVTAAACCGGSK